MTHSFESEVRDLDDVSEETYNPSEEESVSMASSSEEEEDLGDQPIRVYDARFKIPA